MLTVLTFAIGAFMGLVVFGIAATFAMALGAPEGPGWFVVLAPFVVFMGWLCCNYSD